MLASFLITLREGLEAALIVGIVLSVLRKLRQTDKKRPVWLGVLAAVLVSVAAGWLLNLLGIAFEGRGEEIFEGLAMLLAAGVLTWMIFWMQRQGRQVEAELERDVRQAVTTGSAWALFSLSFVAVVREGIETALFMNAAAFSATPTQTLIGGLLGLAVAIFLGWLIFVAGKELNLRAFFWGTSILLLIFAAGLLAHGVHELQEAGLVPIVVEHVYDINSILDEKGTLGTFLKALLGYNGNPSLLEMLAYVGYLVLVGVLLGRGWRTPVRARPAQAPQTV